MTPLWRGWRNNPYMYRCGMVKHGQSQTHPPLLCMRSARDVCVLAEVHLVTGTAALRQRRIVSGWYQESQPYFSYASAKLRHRVRNELRLDSSST